MEGTSDSTRPGRILIADDEPANHGVLRRLLAGYDVRSCGSGDEVLAALEAGESPDLILLDVVMPGTTGFDVCERIKHDQRWSHIPVIFITGLGDAESEVQGLALGAVDYIPKPFRPAVVRARVGTHLALKAATDRLSVRNATLSDEVAARNAQLSMAVEAVRVGALETVVRLSRAAEFRDEDTGEHLLRISYYAAAVGRSLGLTDASVELLLRAAPLHDIGKIAIPDHILLKQGGLDASEWEVMKQHPVTGARILAGSPSEVIRLGETVALSHHERWDGTGYPHKLSGSDIPLAGRIVAVVDVFDALTSTRPYKRAYQFDVAVDLIRDARGAAFDPGVVDAFLASEQDIRDIQATYPDHYIAQSVPLSGRPTLPPFDVSMIAGRA